MTIKELEKILNIPRATIRYYEKENFIKPQRNDNNYRDYTEDDLNTLKKIIVFRKLGIKLEDIHKIFSKENSIEEIMCLNINSLKKQINDLQGAVKISNEIYNKKEDLHNFNVDYYLKVISDEESKGNKFADIAKDIIVFEKKMVLKRFNLLEKDIKNHPVKSIIKCFIVCIFFGIFFMINNYITNYNSNGFFYGFIFPLAITLVTCIIGLPIFLIFRKNDKLKKLIDKIDVIVGMILLISSIMLIIIRNY